MKKRYLILSALAASFLLASETNMSNIVDINSSSFITKDNNVSNMFAENEAIIVFKDGTMASQMVKTLQSLFGSQMKHNEFSLINGMHITVPDKSFEQIKAMIENMPMSNSMIKSIEKNYANASFKSNDTYYDKLWAIENTGQSVNNKSGTSDADMDVDEAWKIEKGEHNVVVAVLDTGIDYTHNDLADNMWDGNAHHGYDFAGDDDGNNDDDPMPDTPYDDKGHYHGTHVAGTIGAIGDNSNGVSGVAQNVQIMAIKIFRPNGYGYSSDILEGLDYVSKQIDNGVNVVAINASYGGGGGKPGDSMDEAIQKLGDKGVVFCAAAGNDGKDIDSEPVYPASYSATNIITVAASDQDDKLASFSNYGKDTVEVSAPGTNILSTYPDNQYAYLQGTSMATPNVTGTVALLASVNPSSSVEDRIKAVENNVDVKNSLTNKVSTDGRVNTYKAVKALSDDSSANNPPVANKDSATTEYETKVTIDVLKNDTDKDGDTLNLKSVTNPEHGSTVINNGKVDYTPESGFSGTDTFSYAISDGNGGEDSTTVTVTVEDKPNTAPIANNDSATTEYETAITIDALKNDTDEDGDILRIKSITNPNSGSVKVENGKIKYTPNSGFSGDDSFKYTISDGNGGEASANVTVTVKDKKQNNHTPVANSDLVQTKYQTKVVIDALKNDTDSDGDKLSLKSITKPKNGVAEIKNGKVEYTPNSNFSGDDSFEYTIRDGNGGEASSTIEVKVSENGNIPPKANDDIATTDYNTEVIIDVLKNDIDEDDDKITIKSISNPEFGKAEIVDNKIKYTPNSNFSGNDTFNYTIEDIHGSTDSSSVKVMVKAEDNDTNDGEYHFPIIKKGDIESVIKLYTNFTKTVKNDYTKFELDNNRGNIIVEKSGDIEIDNTKPPMPQSKFPLGTKLEVKQSQLQVEFDMTKSIWFK